MNTLTFNRLDQPRMLEQLTAALEDSHTFHISVSFLRCSGVGLILDPLRRFLDQGGQGRLLTSDYLGITQPEALDVLRDLGGLECRVQSSAQGFHPKFYTFLGNDRLWVGSSNLSRGGLVDNLEANLLSRDEANIAQAIAGFERLWSRPDVFEPTDEWLSDYIRRRPRLQPPPRIPRSGPPHPNAAQLEALSRLRVLREQGERRAVVVAAPGVGKTYLAAFFARQMQARRILFVSHRLEHLTQARQTFQRVYGDRASTGLVGGGHKETTADLVFCSIQSLREGSPLLKRGFDLMVVDELHHAAAPSYQRALQVFSPRFLLGLTATPERQDGLDVIRLCDYNIAYEVRLIEAIDRGWLLPFSYYGVADTTVEWDRIPWKNGQFDPTELENALLLEERVEVILRSARERGFDGPRRATVGFCAGVRHARYMADALSRRGLRAAVLTGEDSLEKRADTMAHFADPAHPLEWLFVADLLNEGVDIPAINSLLFLRPTQSPTVFLQQLGRGLRLTRDCEVLTVIDFVGHHRNAWLALEVLSDTRRSPNASTRAGITPPRGCEIILDDQTLAILTKVHRHSRSKKERCLAAYRQLRAERGAPPLPIDLWGRDDMPPFSDFRAAHGDWMSLRKRAGDAAPWEKRLPADHALCVLLQRCERDWQQQRVYAYALLYGMITHRTEPEVGCRAFFDRFPRWRVEQKALSESKAWQTIGKKLGPLVLKRQLVRSIFGVVPEAELAAQVLGRLQLTLEKDFRTRHGGVLRTPEALIVHSRYRRAEIVNHFGHQYDPARHGTGVLSFDQHTAIITKLDTSGAHAEYQYTNRFLSPTRFQWQSQNRQRQDNAAGQRITQHEHSGVTLHLFVQRGSASDAIYMGAGRVASVAGDGPMTVTFELTVALSAGAAADLGVVV
ncbi:MAG: superfamily II DNA or RNA helicase/HKD family nuclease [Myxococcota bacterium]|jgi:superfamily II DNA or RNA helicase/HKD family nuclease